jgi:hypothetical protein
MEVALVVKDGIGGRAAKLNDTKSNAIAADDVILLAHCFFPHI